MTRSNPAPPVATACPRGAPVIVPPEPALQRLHDKKHGTSGYCSGGLQPYRQLGGARERNVAVWSSAGVVKMAGDIALCHCGLVDCRSTGRLGNDCCLPAHRALRIVV